VTTIHTGDAAVRSRPRCYLYFPPTEVMGVGVTMPRRPLSLLVVGLLLASCTGGPEGGEGPSEPSAAEVGNAPGDAPEDEATAPFGRLRLAGFREDQAGGKSVDLRSVEVDEAGHILIDFEAVNSGTRVLRLNGLATIVEDDLGNRYPFRPPPDNDDLTLDSDQRMAGTLAFEGPIAPEARRLVVGFNQRTAATVDELVSAQERPAFDQFPPMLFRDVPLPGVGLEDEARTDAGGSLLDTQVVEVGQTASPDAAPDVEITIVSYETDGRILELDLEAVNRSGVPVSILSSLPVLTDDLGSRFEYRPAQADAAERQLLLEPGTEASATLGFRAPLRPAATELRLTLNSFGLRSPNERAPGIEFVLPMPDVDTGEGT
jgi:hypothetical protein